jgi:hypothetical protein
MATVLYVCAAKIININYIQAYLFMMSFRILSLSSGESNFTEESSMIYFVHYFSTNSDAPLTWIMSERLVSS